MSILKVKKLNKNAKIPLRATKGSAGMDLYACIDEPMTIAPHTIKVVPTGLAIELESGDQARDRARQLRRRDRQRLSRRGVWGTGEPDG